MLSSLGLVLGVAMVSVASVLIRLSDAPPAALATYRLGLAFLVLTPIVLARGWPRLGGRRQVALTVLAGLALAAHFLLWITSLAHTSVASSVLLITLHPLMVLPLATLTGERVGRRQVAGTLLALLGLVVTTGGFATVGARGDVMALAGAVMMGTYLLLGKQVRMKVGALPYVWMVYGVAALALLAWSLFTGTQLTGYPAQEHALFWALALVPTLGGHGLLNWALPRAGAARVSSATLGEPLGATTLAFLVLGELPAGRELAGGATILLGLVLIVGRERRRAGRNGDLGRGSADRGGLELG